MKKTAKNPVHKHHKISKVGIFLSGACAVHCLATPLLTAFAPALANLFSIGHSFEWIVFLITIPLGFFMILKNPYWKYDSKVPFALINGATLLFLITMAIPENKIHEVLFFSSGILVAISQFANLRVLLRGHDCETHG